MTPASFSDIAIQLVATDRSRAQHQVRDIGERLAQGSNQFSNGKPRVPYTDAEARNATRARDALLRELLRTV
jgi:hypothetical protein